MQIYSGSRIQKTIEERRLDLAHGPEKVFYLDAGFGFPLIPKLANYFLTVTYEQKKKKKGTRNQLFYILQSRGLNHTCSTILENKV